jgi:hypothetical protein
MEVTPSATQTSFIGLNDVRDAASDVIQVAAFSVEQGKPGVHRV